MAQVGNYTDPPSRRMAYDSDGTHVILIRGNLSSVQELTPLQKQTLNDESSSGNVQVPWSDSQVYLAFIFPEKRNLTHYFAVWQKDYHYASITGTSVQWSENTTNGMDGDWESLSSWVTNSNNGDGASTPLISPGAPSYRENINSMAVDGVIAVRFLCTTDSWAFVNNSFIYAHHLYGYKFAGETPHRLDFTDSDGEDLMIDFDYGDQPRGTERSWSPTTVWNQSSGLFIRNRSADKIAADVALSCEDLTGSMADDILLSKDNSVWSNQLTWLEIGPRDLIGPIYVKHTTDDEATLGLRAARLKINVGSWE